MTDKKMSKVTNYVHISSNHHNIFRFQSQIFKIIVVRTLDHYHQQLIRIRMKQR